jgi:hypothetical protein
MSEFTVSVTSRKMHEANMAPHLKQLQLRLFFNDYRPERQAAAAAGQAQGQGRRAAGAR